MLIVWGSFKREFGKPLVACHLKMKEFFEQPPVQGSISTHEFI